ncbi:MAG TPA: DNA repair protein RecN [Bacteroidales bacterium]|nr:DNA repair protein RecN [Bacteroidales bacterium]HPF02688.1 DNA repair protein RecN [Bacteroidales bacterium]HPJ58485.1 DNA repair protein RecN [Bacteroidales bacterium]HPR11660.1 DNA repair protein RecN [Bacteroidales bacterium]HRW85020.1 DNA repair protein RecN [Bacteroidales bacterium]
MLVKLYVQNYALIRELDIELENGLTIITGETGAGKTILLGALSLILGNRADTSVLLEKSEKCVVEGTFRIEEYDLAEFFNYNELDYDALAILRREINPAGKSRAFINDTPVNLSVLKELGDRLIDIHSQHQTLMLHENTFQMNVIDSFAGTLSLLDDYQKIYRRYRSLKKDYDDARSRITQNQSDFEYFSFQLDQLEKAKLVEGEQEELEKEQELLNHAEEIKIGLGTASGLLSSESDSILARLREVKNILQKIRDFLPEAEHVSDRTDSVWIELNDLAGEIEKMAFTVDADPGRLLVVNDRLDALYSLISKHRVSGIPELIALREEIRKNVSTLALGDEKLAEMEKLLTAEHEKLSQMAAILSEKRKSVLPDVEKKITELLKNLGMPNARFRISLSHPDGFSSSGTDHADFLFSANKQVEPENLAKTASGGELSRVMLSLKSLLTRNINLPTIIFDEIDSGVSGEVADKVGRILAGMGKYMQVINITHLPQVAARGYRHYHVYKDDTGDSTITRVKRLSDDERILEVARLLSGSEITDSSLNNARELIRSAQQ